jgi:hypothetical protein
MSFALCFFCNLCPCITEYAVTCDDMLQVRTRAVRFWIGPTLPSHIDLVLSILSAMDPTNQFAVGFRGANHAGSWYTSNGDSIPPIASLSVI